MPATPSEVALEERVARLEELLADVIAGGVSAPFDVSGSWGQQLDVDRLLHRSAADADLPILPAEVHAGLDRVVARVAGTAVPPNKDVSAGADVPMAADLSATASRWAAGMSMSDLVGGRVLAWLGGAATLLGIVLFLVLAVSHGWIGHEARVLLAGAASVLLVTAGAWLHAHRGRTEAATAMVGTAIAGMFATLVVAGEIYHLIPPLAAVAASIVVGAVATVLATRWAGQAIGALGLVGALLSPVLVGAPADGATVAVLAVAAACAMVVVVRARWAWLALIVVIVCAPQWGRWVLVGEPALAGVAVLCGFAILGLIGAVGVQLSSPADRLVRSSAAILLISGCSAAVLGHIAIGQEAGSMAGDLWLFGLAGVYAASGAVRARRLPISLALRQLLIGLAVTLADIAFALIAHGLALPVGWGITAIGFAWMARRSGHGARTDALLDLGLGAHVALVLFRTVVEAPPSGIATGNASLAAVLAISMLAASCLACGRLTGARQPIQRMGLELLGLVAIAYLTATTLDGAALVAALAFEGLVLAQLHARTGELVARLGGFGFMGLASLYATTVLAPPTALISGVSDLGSAAVALGAVAVTSTRVGLMMPRASAQRRGLLLGASGTALYLAAVTIITVFQPTGASAGSALLDLSVRQQGQVALSVLLALVGLGALLVGLRRNIGLVRTTGLALLLLTVAKVFLYDLSALTSGYRVMSFIVLGLLLLAGAFAYQRMRPPPMPDIRSMHPSQR